jgi:ferritin-like metal-binding protein YciE
MPETTTRELKLIQYLNEAYGKEKQLEAVLQLQIGLVKAADRTTIEKRLKEHLKETRDQSKGLERRIKALGGKAETSSIPGPEVAGNVVGAAANVANKALAAAKGPIQALRGTSPADNLLRNMRDSYWNEAEEIAHYRVIEAVAEQLGDKETVKLAKEFRRQEERMQAFLEKQIPQLVKDVIKSEVAKEDIPAASSSRSRSTSGRSTSGRSTSRSGGSSPRKSASSARKSGSTTRRSSGASTRSRASTSGSSSGGSSSSS